MNPFTAIFLALSIAFVSQKVPKQETHQAAAADTVRVEIQAPSDSVMAKGEQRRPARGGIR